MLLASDTICSGTVEFTTAIGSNGFELLTNKLGIRIFQNPTNGILNFESTIIPTQTAVDVYNILGKLIIQ
jgi:hypothetical protein